MSLNKAEHSIIAFYANKKKEEALLSRDNEKTLRCVIPCLAKADVRAYETKLCPAKCEVTKWKAGIKQSWQLHNATVFLRFSLWKEGWTLKIA